MSIFMPPIRAVMHLLRHASGNPPAHTAPAVCAVFGVSDFHAPPHRRKIEQMLGMECPPSGGDDLSYEYASHSGVTSSSVITVRKGWKLLSLHRFNFGQSTFKRLVISATQRVRFSPTAGIFCIFATVLSTSCRSSTTIVTLALMNLFMASSSYRWHESVHCWSDAV